LSEVTQVSAHLARGQTLANTPRVFISFDVEAWFQVENLRPAFPPESWDSLDLRLTEPIGRVLQILAKHEAKATFFVLGCIAKRQPELVLRIAEAGHEIACHGDAHQLPSRLGPRLFREDLCKARDILEGIIGKKVLGFRAPSFNYPPWIPEILVKEGFVYSSSLFPTVAHDRYTPVPPDVKGKWLFQWECGLHEILVSSLPVVGRHLPWGGGGYFRILPSSLFRAGVRKILKEGRPFVFYLHPWEIDPDQPRVRTISRTARFRHYWGLSRTARHLDRLLAEFGGSPLKSLVT